MIFGSLCSGIEGAACAWHELGWQAAFISEISKFPSAVLEHRFPGVPNYGDMSKFKEWPDADFDVLVGGTPCQSFSVAGLRKGLDDPRGNLMLVYGAIAARYRPKWLVWENVPGVLSSNSGLDFASFLGLLTGTQIDVPADGWQNSGIVAGIPDAYGVAYRVLDAQYFGVPQRRRRVIVVGYLGDWRVAAAVLLEFESLRGDPPPSRQARQGTAAGTLRSSDGGSDENDARDGRLIPDVAGTLGGASQEGGFRTTDLDNSGAFIPAIANPLTARMHKGVNTTCDEGPTMIVQPVPVANMGVPDVAHALRADSFDAGEDGTGCGTPLVPVAYSMMPMNSGKDFVTRETTIAQPLMAAGQSHGDQGGDVILQPTAFSCKDHGADAGELSPTLRSMGHDGSHANAGGQVAVCFDTAVAFDLRGREGGAQFEGPHDTASIRAASGGSSRSYVADAFAFKASHFTRGKDGAPSDVVPPLSKEADKGDQDMLVAFNIFPASGQGADLEAAPTEVSNALSAVQQGKRTDRGTRLAGTSGVRRLTPRECERLQGFPDDWTALPGAKDGPRYKALGNAFAVPMLKWVGQRIQLAEEIIRDRADSP
jgi:DNA (cytosine-5)-methyltransferase 1